MRCLNITKDIENLRSQNSIEGLIAATGEHRGGQKRGDHEALHRAKRSPPRNFQAFFN
jgi:hypothetical protein